VKNAKTSIIILTYNKMDYTKKCIESIRKFTEREKHEIIVIDNASNDGTLEWLEMQKDIIVVANKENLGFPKGCNQGIEIATGNEILLLNNDVIVTFNWLEKLRKALYSSDEIGAVGPITNYCSNYQSIKTTYKTIDEMHEFAKNFNVNKNGDWEYRLKLVGYCMLIKKEVVDKIGLLDEIFTPGNFEDDDYSLRIINQGYKLIVCHDTFIHHFGSVTFKNDIPVFGDLLQKNSKKFEEKWGFDATYSMNIRHDIIDMIDCKKENLTVLEVGCACGATLLKIKSFNGSADLYGIELNNSAAAIANTFAKVTADNIESNCMSFKEGFFDYIIFADVLEHLNDPLLVLNNMKKYLKDGGKLLASIPNVMHFTVLRGLLGGTWTYQDAGILDRTHIRFFTFHEIHNMFKEAGYVDMSYASTNIGKRPEDDKFIDDLMKINGVINTKGQFEAYQYLVSATNKNEEFLEKETEIVIDEYCRKFIVLLLRRIENELDLDNSIDTLLEVIAVRQVSPNFIAECIKQNMVYKSSMLNTIAKIMHKKDNIDFALKIMEFAYEYDNNDQETLKNLAKMLYQLEEKETALLLLQNSNEKNAILEEIRIEFGDN